MNIWYVQYYAYESQFRYGYVHEITAVHIVDSARAMVDRLEFEVMKHLE